VRDMGDVEYPPGLVQLQPSSHSQWVYFVFFRGIYTHVSPSSALDLTNPLPPALSLNRWAAEPIKHIFLPCTSFIPNAKGYPVLSKSMQTFLKTIFKVRLFTSPPLSSHSRSSSQQFRPTFIISGTHRHVHTSGGPHAYAQYVRYLHRKSNELAPVEEYAQGYMDHLQQPLQPLMDNLEGETYEGFEKDPIKYRQYEEAVYRALCDRGQDTTTYALLLSRFLIGAG
jgi:protein arginine N-methyltransferase 5